jgi:hypothetical protein
MMTTLLLSAVLGTANFPAALAAASQGPLPGCEVCHQGPQSKGTVTTPFGTAMRQRGLVAYDEASLSAAWAQMAGVDSDGDGVTDIDELKNGQNPNASSTGSAVPTPDYGCMAAPGAWTLGLFSLWFVRRRRPTSGQGTR